MRLITPGALDGFRIFTNSQQTKFSHIFLKPVQIKSWMRSTTRNGGRLWGAGARDRFGSPLRYSGNGGRKPTASLVPEVYRIRR